ncbi:MAG: twin-arginine translocase TatA/TatE family subunit [Gammaproteobacteria bacterium]
MFEIGFWELALLGALGLIILGPEKLPRVAAQLGRYIGQARRMARTLTAQIHDELEAEERRINAAEAKAARPESAREPTPDPSSDSADNVSADTASAENEIPDQPVFSRPGAADLIPGKSAANAAGDTAVSAPVSSDADTTTNQAAS